MAPRCGFGTENVIETTICLPKCTAMVQKCGGWTVAAIATATNPLSSSKMAPRCGFGTENVIETTICPL
jgi:hypothetical protein